MQVLLTRPAWFTVEMNEPPGARVRVGLCGLTEAEYFRDKGPGRLLFIDDISVSPRQASKVFRASRSYALASVTLPTLATEMGDLQERITSTKTGTIASVSGRLRSR